MNFFKIAKGNNFAVAFDWKSKNSQNVRILWFFKTGDGFSKKILIFFEFLKGGKFAVECVSNGIFSLKCHFRPNHEVFSAKSQKNLSVGKIREYDEERVLFSRENVFIF